MRSNTDRITDAPPRPALERILGDGLINILFVGRIVPNKRIEDHIRLAEMYKRYVDSYYRFIFVGRYDGMPRYYAQIRALIAEYEMLPDRFWFTGPVPDEDLAAFYRWADVYVSLSEHEGFCVPLVEAMAADVPVAGLCAPAAVPETLGGAGVLFAPEGSRVRRRDCSAALVVRSSDVRAPRRSTGQRAAARRVRRLARPRSGLAVGRLRQKLQIQPTCSASREFTCEDRVHRPALRHRDPRRLRVSLPADRRTPRPEAPGRGADDLRAATTSPGRTSTRKAPTASAA